MRGREKRLGTKGWFQAGEDFPPRRLWLIVPFCSCTHRAGLSDCSSDGGIAWVPPREREELMLEKLGSALAHWLLGGKREKQPELLNVWHLQSSFGCSQLSQRWAVLLRTDHPLVCPSLAAVQCSGEHPVQQQGKDQGSPTELLARRLLLSFESLNLSPQCSFQAKSL